MSARDGKDKAASPFRQESLDRAKSPEQLDDYIRVSNPGVWMVLGAVLLLLLAGFIWACCGRLVDTMPTALVVQGGHATCYVAEDEVGPVSYTHLTLPTNREEYILVVAVTSRKQQQQYLACLRRLQK